MKSTHNLNTNLCSSKHQLFIGVLIIASFLSTGFLKAQPNQEPFINANSGNEELTQIGIDWKTEKEIRKQVNETPSPLDWGEGKVFGQYTQEQEIISNRDAFNKHFINNDGTMTNISSSAPLHYKDENNNWRTIKLEIENHNKEVLPNYKYANIENSFKTYFPNNVNEPIITIAFGEKYYDWKSPEYGYKDKMGNYNTLSIGGNAVVNVESNKIIYKNVYPYSDVRFTQTKTGRKQDVIIREREALNGIPTDAKHVVYSENVVLPKGWSISTGKQMLPGMDSLAELPINVIYILNEKQEIMMSYSPPIIYEENPPARPGLNELLESLAPDDILTSEMKANLPEWNHIPAVYGHYEIIKNGNEVTIKTLVPAEWLTNEERVFPVIVDPTYTVYTQYVQYHTGYVYNGTDKYWGVLATGVNRTYRGYARWSPSMATGDIINGVRMFFGVGYTSYGRIYAGWYQMTYDPLSANASTIYNDAYDGTQYGFGSYYVDNDYTIDLGAQAITDLDGHRTWFGVGLTMLWNDSDDGWVYGGNYGEPYLYIDYTPCTPPTSVIAYANGSTAATICNGSSVTLTEGTYSGGLCSGNWEYCWRIGGTTVRDWSTTETYTTSPSSNTTYTLDMRCSACSGTYTSDDVTVTVNQPPSGTATPAASYVGLGLSTTISVSGSYSSIVRWERRINGGTWTNIASTASTINTGIMNPSGTWEYRALLKRDPCSDVYSSIATVQVNYPIAHNYGTSGYPSACALGAGGWSGYVCFWTGATNNNWSEAGNWIRWLATSAGGNAYTYINQVPQAGDYVEISRNVDLVRTECIVNTNTNIISHLVVMAGTKLTVNSTLNIGNTTGENWETALHVHSGGEISISNSSGVINLDNGTTTTGTGGSGGTGGLGYCFTVNGTFNMSAGNVYADDDMIVTGTVSQSGGNIYLGYHPSTGAKSYDGALYVSGADFAAYNHSAGNLYIGRRFYTSGGYGSYESGKGYYRGSGTSTVTVGAYSGSTEPQIIVSDNANNSYLNNLVISGNIVLYTQPSTPLIINGLFTINTGSSLNTQSNSMIIGGNWTNNGTFTPGTGTVTFNGTTAISGSTASHDFYNININNGKSLTAPGGNLNVAGNWTNNGIFSAGTGTVVLYGTGAQVIGGTANTTFYNLNVNRSTTSNALIFGDAVNSGKTFTVDNTFIWTDNNDIIQIGQTGASAQRLIVPTINIPAGCTLQFDNNTANYLDINNGGATVSLLANGTLIQGIGTVTFNGTEAQYLRSSYDISFYNLVVNRNTVNAFTIGNSGTTNITFAVTNSFSWVDHDDIIILGLTASGQTLSVPSITIPAGCTLQDASNVSLLHHINVSGNWINNGTFTAGNGTVVFSGNAPQTITSGSSSFNNIIFNNTGNGNADIVLTDGLNINGQAIFTDGIVSASSHKVVFGALASTNTGTSSSFVDGKVEKTDCTGLFTIPTGHVVTRNIGLGDQTYAIWAPIGLDPASTATVNARYFFSNEGLNTWWYHDWTHESPLTHTSSREYWLVNSPVALSATLYWKNNTPCSIHDFCEEGTGTFMSDDLTVAYWSGIWKNAGGSASGSSENGLITSGSIPLGSIGSKGETQITFGSKNPDLSLPVELLSFGAECKDGSVLLSWTTASEINNDYFELERSDDGTNWNVIAHVEGAGNSNEELKYSFIEIIKISGIVYYRLRQVDYDGSSKLSDMVQVRCNDDLIKPSVMLYPNPFNNQLFVATENWDMNSLDMELYDMLGKKLATWSFDGVSPEFVKQLDIADLPPAMYVVKIKTSTGITVRKIEKK